MKGFDVRKRQRSRTAAMEVLFSGNREEMDKDEFFQDLTELREESSEEEAEDRELDSEYIRKVVGYFDENRDSIENLISSNLKDTWTMDRLSRIDRAILSLASTEILYMPDIDGKVSINEALELTKKYSEKESVKFINNVLDSVLKNSGKNLSDSDKETATDTETETEEETVTETEGQ